MSKVLLRIGFVRIGFVKLLILCLFSKVIGYKAEVKNLFKVIKKIDI